MIKRVRGRFAPLAAVVWVLVSAALLSPRARVSAEALPKQISDRAFWQMIVDFSEPAGVFRSDNLVSNERTFQVVIPELKRRISPGGVYVGVGPDQNFTYISALRPRLAFVIDIRRQNMLLHLMYKALIEMSDDRAQFLSRLFSRPEPRHLDRMATPQTLFAAYGGVPASDEMFRKNLRSIADRLVGRHGFALTTSDLLSIEYVYRAFYLAGPNLRYSFPQQFGMRFPTYAELMLETDGAGHNHSYMASEANFRVLRDLEKNNLLIPLVGDFSGDKTIRRIGQYVREHGATVTAFYTSNVEQYLFQSDAWSRFFANVSTMPINASSTLIRSYFNLRFTTRQDFVRGPQSEMLLDPIAGLLGAFHGERFQTYGEVIERSRQETGR